MTWQIVVIVFHAFSLELMRICVKSCRDRNAEPSVPDLVTWGKNDVVNPNYNFYYDLIFNMFLGIKCFRSGVRKNNSRFMLAGRQVVAPLMYIGKHRIYQTLIARDLQNRASAPKEVSEYMEKNESYSVSGDTTKGEGAIM